MKKEIKKCWEEHYNGIQFSNFFVWGDKTITTMETPGCLAPCSATDVVAGSSITCDNVKDRESNIKALLRIC